MVRGTQSLLTHSRLGLDTNIFIYLVQDHPRYGTWCVSLFESIEQGHILAATSTVSLLEILVQPYRRQNDELVKKFYGLFSTYPKLSWIPVSLDVADQAAEFRARYHLSTPDAIQVATAISFEATGFLGNDKGLKNVKEIECMILDDLV